MNPKLLFSILLIIGAASGQSTAQEAPQPKVRIGEIYFFGYQADGLDVAKIRAALPVHAGQELKPGENFRPGITRAVMDLTGHPPTDIAMICCNEKGARWLYIGLAGKSYKPLVFNPVPQGTARLPDAAIKLEREFEDALENAVKRGDSGEDDSQGYALNHDPEMRARELAIREFALKNEELLCQVLATSRDAEHRQTAAEFLGYAAQSQKQIDALVEASRDGDDGVRNNATRALSVLASSSPTMAGKIPAAGFINMLNSGTWTDRNKGSAVLMDLSRSRDPGLLTELRARAMPGLIEIAHWDTGHAMTRSILGRLAGMSEENINKMGDQLDDVENLINAAQKVK
ncbi:MAG TPA: HEAT repeat domain-containing protein [Candidatus Angelobacter sp.]|nr:HEAT repeat domain-containing protein [Candidatus Angelobacter sp.]